MTKARQQRRREARRLRKQQRRQATQKVQPKRRLRIAVTFFVAALGVVASLIGIDSYFSSRITIRPGSPIDTSDSFSTPFEISNNGWLAITDVEVSCLYSKVEDVNHNTFTNVGQGWFTFPKIQPNHPATVQCRAITSDAPFLRGDITINIAYSPRFLSIRKHEQFRYMVERGSDGVLHWLPQPNP